MKSLLNRVIVCSLLAASGLAQASIVITGTRVIYPAAEREVTVKLNNNGSSPELGQAWIDDGDVNMEAQERVTPFTLLPPIFRIEPGKGQTLRMMYSGQALPQDRESVFYLNVLEIPPRPTEQQVGEKNVLQMAFRSRLKIFYRPSGLPGTADDAPGLVNWQVVHSGSGYVLRADNPSAYSVSIARCVVRADGKDYPTPSGMIPPKGSFTFPIPELKSQPVSPEIVYTAINDYGALHDFRPGGKRIDRSSASQ